MQKRIFLSTFVLAIFFNIATAQKTRNVFWIMPTKAEKVNGVCLTFMSPEIFEERHSVTVNGLNLSADLSNVMAAFIGVVHVVFGDTAARKNLLFNYLEIGSEKSTFTINGINAGTGSLIIPNINGLNIQGIYTFGEKVNGLSLTPLISKLYNYNGLLISGLYNKTTIGKGVQIALINDCNDCQGVQIGLVNKMGKRTLPFINMRFKKKNAKSLLPSHANK